MNRIDCATDQQKAACKVCSKTTGNDCSHVDCPNRRQLTAAAPDDESVRPIRGGGQIRVPIRYD